MAKEDAQIAALLFGYVLPALIVLALLWYVVRIAPTAWQWFFATTYSRLMSNRLHLRVKCAKEELFNEMQKLESMNTPGGNVRILEIGVGSGSNFQYYPKNCRLVCYDPNPFFRSYLFDNALDYPNVHLERLVVAGGERLVGTQDETVDAVVTTLVLCSVRDMSAVLREVVRVLPKGGKFFFLEHVCAHPGTHARRLQEFVNPIWHRLSGCSLLTDVDKAVRSAGFSSVKVKYFNMDARFPVKQLVGRCLMGVATK